MRRPASRRGRVSRPAGVRRRLLAICATGLAAVSACGCGATPPAGSVLDTAELWVGEAERPPQETAGWRAAPLPDVWGVRRRRVATRGWYRLRVQLSDAPVEPWMVMLPRLALNAEVWLNGTSLGAGGRMDERPSRNTMRSIAFAAPAPLWRVGPNEIHVHLVTTPGAPGSLHPLVVGPARELTALQASAERRQLLGQVAALFAAMLGSILLYSSVRRRRSHAQAESGAAAASGAWVGTALLLIAATCVSLFLPHLSVPPRLLEWCVGVAFNAAVLSLAVGLRRATGIGSTRGERVLVATYAAAALGFGLVPWIWSFPVWVVWTLVSSGVMLRGLVRAGAHALRTRSPVWGVGTALAGAALAGIGANSVAAATRVPIGHVGWWIGGSFLACVGVFLVLRLVAALRRAEDESERLEARVAEREAELAANHERIRVLERAEVVRAERERMTREMHDGTGGLLVAALSLARRTRESADLESLLEDALDELRLALDSLQPGTTDLPTLLGLLRPRLERQLRSAGLELVWRVSDAGEDETLDPERILDVVRIVQEAITNAARHSGGHRVTLETGRLEDAGGLWLEIDDDGGGGAVAEGDGRGLVHLRERATRLGAELEIDSSPGGTRVRVVLPPPSS